MIEVYICDPEKHKDCDRTACRAGLCKSTTIREYAKLDANGEPIHDLETEEALNGHE